jgi:hypothetical protein
MLNSFADLTAFVAVADNLSFQRILELEVVKGGTAGIVDLGIVVPGPRGEDVSVHCVAAVARVLDERFGYVAGTVPRQRVLKEDATPIAMLRVSASPPPFEYEPLGKSSLS